MYRDVKVLLAVVFLFVSGNVSADLQVSYVNSAAESIVKIKSLMPPVVKSQEVSGERLQDFEVKSARLNEKMGVQLEKKIQQKIAHLNKVITASY